MVPLFLALPVASPTPAPPGWGPLPDFEPLGAAAVPAAEERLDDAAFEVPRWEHVERRPAGQGGLIALTVGAVTGILGAALLSHNGAEGYPYPSHGGL